MSIRNRLLQVFRDTLDLGPEVAVEGLRYRDLPAWNSVGHMQLVAAIEAEFDLMLETEEIIAMSSFEDAERTVGHHLAARA
jgi:acyl carrier protein